MSNNQRERIKKLDRRDFLTLSILSLLSLTSCTIEAAGIRINVQAVEKEDESKTPTATPGNTLPTPTKPTTEPTTEPTPAPKNELVNYEYSFGKDVKSFIWNLKNERGGTLSDGHYEAIFPVVSVKEGEQNFWVKIIIRDNKIVEIAIASKPINNNETDDFKKSINREILIAESTNPNASFLVFLPTPKEFPDGTELGQVYTSLVDPNSPLKRNEPEVVNLKKGTINGSLVNGNGFFTEAFYVFYALPRHSDESLQDPLLDHLKIIFGGGSLEESVEKNNVYDKYEVIPSN